MALVLVVVVGTIVAIVVATWAAAERSRRQEAAAETAKERTRTADIEAGLDVALEGLEALGEGVVVLHADEWAAYTNGAARELLGRRVSNASDLAPAVLR